MHRPKYITSNFKYPLGHLHMLLVDVVPKVGELSEAVGTLASWSSAEDERTKLDEHFTSYLDLLFITDEMR